MDKIIKINKFTSYIGDFPMVPVTGINYTTKYYNFSIAEQGVYQSREGGVEGDLPTFILVHEINCEEGYISLLRLQPWKNVIEVAKIDTDDLWVTNIIPLGLISQDLVKDEFWGLVAQYGEIGEYPFTIPSRIKEALDNEKSRGKFNEVAIAPPIDVTYWAEEKRVKIMDWSVPMGFIIKASTISVEDNRLHSALFRYNLIGTTENVLDTKTIELIPEEGHVSLTINGIKEIRYDGCIIDIRLEDNTEIVLQIVKVLRKVEDKKDRRKSK